MITGIFVVPVNLLVDLCYGLLDPIIRYGKGGDDVNPNVSTMSNRKTARTNSFRYMLRKPMTLIGLVLLSIIILLTLIGPVIAPNDPLTVNLSERLQPPSWEYPLGTDPMGRCIFSRLMAGAQTTLGVSVLAMGAVAVVGVPIGLLSGTIGGRVDAVLMRIVDGLGAYVK